MSGRPGPGGAPRQAPNAASSDPRIAALVKLVRAVARREPLAGYAIKVAAIRVNERSFSGFI